MFFFAKTIVSCVKKRGKKRHFVSNLKVKIIVTIPVATCPWSISLVVLSSFTSIAHTHVWLVSRVIKIVVMSVNDVFWRHFLLLMSLFNTRSSISLLSSTHIACNATRMLVYIMMMEFLCLTNTRISIEILIVFLSINKNERQRRNHKSFIHLCRTSTYFYINRVFSRQECTRITVRLVYINIAIMLMFILCLEVKQEEMAKDCWKWT